MKDKIRTLLIGCGKAGVLHELDKLRKKPASLIGGLIEYKEYFDLVGAVDIDLKRARKVKEFFPDVDVFSDYRIAIKKLKPDVIIIATWTGTHKEIFNYSLKSEVKGIILEKPLAKNMSETNSMLRAWKRNKIPVVINYPRRWEPRYLFIKELINSKELGKLKTVYGKVLLGSIPRKYEDYIYDIEGGGTMLHDGTHLIDLINFYFKRVKILSSDVVFGKILDITTNALLLGNGKIPIHLEVGGERGYFEFSLRFEFEAGAVKIGNGIMEWFTAKPSKIYTGYRDLKRGNFPFDRLKKYKTNGFSGPFFDMKNALEGKNNNISSSLKDGFKAMKIIYQLINGKI